MTAIASEIDQALRSLDPQRASALERSLRDTLARFRLRPAPAGGKAAATTAVDANGWPIGYWDVVVGCLADDDWEPPPDLPPDPYPEELPPR